MSQHGRLLLPAIVVAAIMTPVRGADSAPGATASAPQTATTTSAAVRDFSAGFDRLKKLGLPDAAGLDWSVDADAAELSRISHGSFDGEPEQPQPPAPGYFAAKAADAKGFTRTVNDALECVVWKGNPYDQDPGEKFNEAPSVPVWATPQAADLDATISKLETWLKYRIEHGELDRWELASCGWSNPKVLIFAAHLHQLGRVDAANRIVSALFTLADARTTLTDVMSQIASAKYDTAIFSLAQTGDWTTAATALKGLLEQFPSGWPERSGVERVLAGVEQYTSGKEPPVLPGGEWTDDDRAWARSLFASGGEPGEEDEFWVFGPEAGHKDGDTATTHDDASKAGVPQSPLAQRGRGALPLLVALMDDQALIRPDPAEIASTVRTATERAMMEEDPSEESLWENGLVRPHTRSEVVTELLHLVTPRKFQGKEVDHEALKAWAIQSSQLPAEALAFSLIEASDDVTANQDPDGPDSSYDSAGRTARQWLAEHVSDAGRDRFEASLLNDKKLAEFSDVVLAYLTKRGEAGREFGQKLLARIDGEMSELSALPGEPHSAQEYMQQQTLRQLKQLRTQLADVAEGKSLSDVIAELGSGKRPWSSFPTILIRIVTLPVDAPEWDAWMDLVKSVHGSKRVDCLYAYVGLAMRADADGKATILKRLRARASDWRELIADTTQLPAQYGSSTVGGVASGILLVTVGALDRDHGTYERAGALGDRFEKLENATALAILDGAEVHAKVLVPEPLPIDAARYQALVALARSGDAAKFDEAVSALSAGEYLDWLQKLHDDPAAASILNPLSERLLSLKVVADPPVDGLEQFAATLKDRKIDTAAMLDEIEQGLVKLSREKQVGLQCVVRRLPGGGGTAILLMALGADSGLPQPRQGQLQVFATAAGVGEVKSGNYLRPLDQDTKEGDQSDAAEYNKLRDDVLAGKYPACVSAFVFTTYLPRTDGEGAAEEDGDAVPID